MNNLDSMHEVLNWIIIDFIVNKKNYTPYMFFLKDILLQISLLVNK
jgi:hypothetical protein